MIVVLIFLIFSGCFALYNTSKKVLLTKKSSIEKWIQQNQKSSKFIGVLFLITGLIFAISQLGKTSGILFWLFIVTTSLSLLIVLYPLKGINYKHITILFLTLLAIELIIKL